VIVPRMRIGGAAGLVLHGQMDLVGARDDDHLAGRQTRVLHICVMFSRIDSDLWPLLCKVITRKNLA
jgi:hypothetical protein